MGDKPNDKFIVDINNVDVNIWHQNLIEAARVLGYRIGLAIFAAGFMIAISIK